MCATVHQLLNDKKGKQAGSRPQISKVPESAVLAQLRSFLPQMQSANDQLSQRVETEPAVSISDLQQESTDSVLEEQEDYETGQHVEMDIACGVVDLKDAAALKAAEDVLNASYVERHQGSSSDSDSDRDSDSDSNCDADPLPTASHATEASERCGSSFHQQSSQEGLAVHKRKPWTQKVAGQRHSKILEL